MKKADMRYLPCWMDPARRSHDSTSYRREAREMWISKKKWQALEKRVADIEGQVQSQPQEIINVISQQLRLQMSKSIRPYHQEVESQSGGQV